VTEAIWLGAMISLSSTMVVLKNLAASGTTNTLASRVMIGLLVLQDLAVVPILIILPQLGQGADPQSTVISVLKATGIAGVFLAGMVLAGTRLLPLMMTRIAKWGSRELFLVALVAVGVGVGFAAYAIGISFALGAFIAGIVLSESELSHQALSDIIPLRDVFGLLFFVSAGMLFDPAYALRHPMEVALLIAIIIVGKAVITGVITRGFGYGNLAPWIVGLGLAQIGEFSFVLARSGKALNLLSKDAYDLALTCTILTIALSPLLSVIAPPLGRFFRSRLRNAKTLDNVAPVASKLSGHILVVGSGRIGRTVAKLLGDAGQTTLSIELDHNRFSQTVTDGLECIYGDATRAEILHAARIENAILMIIAIPNTTAVRMVIEQARMLKRDIPVVARAIEHEDLPTLRALGGDLRIVQPEFEGGLEMARQALDHCDFNPEATAHLISASRLRFNE
jgi:CPA2 family monovalent cation:H+ antiporter-2